MLTRFLSPKGLVYTIDLSKIADRENPRTVEAPFATTANYRGPVIVDWGDGSEPDVFTSGYFPPHEYEQEGVYRVVIRAENGLLPPISFNTHYSSEAQTNPAKNITWAVTSIDHFAGMSWDNIIGIVVYCTGCKNLKYVDPRIIGMPNRTAAYWSVAYCPNLEQPIGSFTCEFMQLTSINALNGMFAISPKLNGELNGRMFAGQNPPGSISALFNGCSGITGSIPGELFSSFTQATGASSIFQNCSGLTGSIPEELFDACINIESLAYAFSGCSNLTDSIPEGLFQKATSVTNFNNVFTGCSKLSGELPTGLFGYNINAQNFAGAFAGCVGLEGIQSGLFSNNGALTTVQFCFQNCTGLTTIPSDLFDNCTQLTSVGHCFDNCSNITGEPYKFWEKSYAGNITNKTDCYIKCSAALRAQVPTGYGGTMTVN